MSELSNTVSEIEKAELVHATSPIEPVNLIARKLCFQHGTLLDTIASVREYCVSSCAEIEEWMGRDESCDVTIPYMQRAERMRALQAVLALLEGK